MAIGSLLLVEDSAADALLIRAVLDDLPGADVTHVDRLDAAVDALRDGEFDLVLLDLNLPDSSGLATFKGIHAVAPDVAVLVLTGVVDEMMGEQAVREGAQDYLIKQSVQAPWLGRAVRYAIERQRSRTIVLQSRQQLRQLAHRLVVVRESERTALSRELHDELGGALTALKMDLRWIDRRVAVPMDEARATGIKAKVAEALETVDEAIGVVQTTALALRPGVLDALGLSDAVVDEGRRFAERSGIACIVNVEAPRPSPDSETSTALFRILQELLTNVARHSRATVVRVSLERRGPFLELEVRDNGVGIDLTAVEARTSLGLLGIEERAAALGGVVHVQPLHDGGTSARVSVPWAGMPAG